VRFREVHNGLELSRPAVVGRPIGTLRRAGGHDKQQSWPSPPDQLERVVGRRSLSRR
jgi:hypothetical protein